MPVSEGVGDSRVGLKDTEICRLPKATEGQVLIRGTEKWEAGDAEPLSDYYDVKVIGAIEGITCLDYVSGGLVLFGDYDGHVLKSDTSSINILELEDIGPVGTNEIYSIIYLENDICLCSEYDGNIHRSTDRGETWTFVQNIGKQRIPLLYIGNGRVLAGSQDIINSNKYLSFYFSDDYGQSFTNSSRFLRTPNSPYTLLHLEGDLCVTVVDGGIYITEDGGEYWDYYDSFPYGSGVDMISGFSLGNGYALMYASDLHIYYTYYLAEPFEIYDLGLAHNFVLHKKTALSFYFENRLEKLKEEEGKVWIRPTGTGDWTELGDIPVGSQLSLTAYSLGLFFYGGWVK